MFNCASLRSVRRSHRATGTSFNDAQMIRTDAVASLRKKNSGNDGRDIDALHYDEQKIAAKYAICQQQQATSKPDYPS